MAGERNGNGAGGCLAFPRRPGWRRRVGFTSQPFGKNRLKRTAAGAIQTVDKGRKDG